MSTILKALRRLEEEKSQQERPGLRESVVASSPADSRKLPFFFVAGAVLALGIAGVSWWQLRQAIPPETVAAAAPPQAPVAPAKIEVATPPTPPPPAAPAVRKIAQPTPPPVAPTPTRPSPSAQTAKAAPAPALPAAAAPADPPAAVVVPTPTPPQVADEPIWAQEVATVKPRPAAEAPPPARAPEPKLKPMAKVPVPEVAVLQTLWHPLPDRRSATVRLAGEEGTRQMSEGDSVQGLVLLKIEPSGVVFAHNGIQIQRRVGR